jgi:hypothetical protein
MNGYSEVMRLVQSVYTDRQAETYVYAIQAGESGPVKIGIAKSPRERLSTLQTAHYEHLHGIAIWRGGRDQEKLLHETFADSRLIGEWFNPTEELLALVDSLGGGLACEWHPESDCLMTVECTGTCSACGFQALDG